VDFSGPVSLLDLVGLEQELSDALNVKVDLVTLRTVNPVIKPYIDKDLIVINDA
jgi:uncharacterized protein